ncbi:hypothetical protein, partial [Nocardioides sp.]|uniref:hypothetical protein n=1 Tax=Nocardioides sp. TaxID=35761 RepID=UPI00197D97E1
MLKQARRAILDEENARVRELLEPIEDEVAFLHSAELRTRLKANFDRSLQWSLIHGYASRREVVETYLG